MHLLKVISSTVVAVRNVDHLLSVLGAVMLTSLCADPMQRQHQAVQRGL